MGKRWKQAFSLIAKMFSMAKFKGRQFLSQRKLTLAKLKYVNNVRTNFQKNHSKSIGGVSNTKSLVFCTQIETQTDVRTDSLTAE